MKNYIRLDEEIHVLSQIIAKINRTYIPKQQDDSHTNIYFDYLNSRIGSRWINTNNKKIIFTLNLTKFQFEWLDDFFNIVYSFSIEELTYNEIENEVLKSIQKLGLPEDGVLEDLHFKIPKYDFIDNKFKKWNSKDIIQWTHYRNIANIASSQLNNFIQTNSEIRIWPHHFDTGIYGIINNHIGLGFGLAMKDSLLSQPYFYMAAYGLNGELNFSSPPILEFGSWVMEDYWKGAVFSLKDFESIPLENQLETIQKFISQTNKYYFTLI